jgi:Arm DNA-binding domain
LLPEVNNMKLINVTPHEGRDEVIIFDPALPGFGIRARANGRKSWIVQYRLGTKQRRLKLGDARTLSEAEARRRAKAALGKVHNGQDPQLEKTEARVQAGVTLGKVTEQYLVDAADRLRPRSLVEVTVRRQHS